MSAEHGHGHGGETTITEVLVSLFLFFLVIPAITTPVEEAVQSIVAPDASGHGGHH